MNNSANCLDNCSTITEMGDVTSALCGNDTDSKNTEEHEVDLIISYNLFREIPLPQRAVLTSSILTLTLTLNILVFKYYSKSKTSNRPYVLALVFLDFLTVFLGHLPTFILSLFEINQTLLTVQFVVYGLTSYLVIICFFPPVFLGIDRYVAVFYPHTFREYKTRIRILKLFTIFVLTSSMFVNLFCERYFGSKSSISVTCRAVVWSICTLLVAVTVAKYIAIALRLFRRNTRIVAAQHVSRNGSR